jgi:hypothetical protein
MDPMAQQFTCVKMPQVMEAILHAGALTNGTPGALEVRRVNALSHAICEDH